MEWVDVIAFFQKWGLELILGGIGAILTGVAGYYYKLAKKGKASEEAEKKQAFKTELTSEIKELIKDVRAQVHAEIESETNDGQRITALETRADILEDTLTAVVDNLELIKTGLLAVQGHEFRNKCRKLLKQEIITPDEYEQLESDHVAYNGLGGNHKGDSLFDQVKAKYYSQLTQ